MSNCPQSDNGVITGTYGQSVPSVFSPPVQPPCSDNSVHVYGAPVPSTFRPPVNSELPVTEPAAPAPAAAPEPVAAPVSATPPAPVAEVPLQVHTEPAPVPAASPVAVQVTPKKEKASSGLASKKLLIFGGIGLAVILVVVLLISGLGGKESPAPEMEAPATTAAPETEQTLPQAEVTQPVADIPQSEYGWWAGDWYGWWVVSSGDGKFENLTDQAWDVCARISVDGEGGSLQIWNSNGSADALMTDVQVTFGPGVSENGAFISESGTFMDAPLEHADWIVDAGVGYMKDFDHMICIDGSYEDPEDDDNCYDYYIFLRPWGMDWEDVRTADHSDNLYNDMMPPMYDTWYAPRMDAAMPDSFGQAAATETADLPEIHEWKEFSIRVVGAEQFTDYEGEDAIRIYYDFTNLSDEASAAYSLASVQVTQDDYEQVYAYANFEDDVPEYGNDSLRIRPGVTIRCVSEYSMKPSGGPVVVTFNDYWGEEEPLEVKYDPQNLPGRPGELEITPITDPVWVLNLPVEGDYDNYSISIDAAEIVAGYDGDVVRVYYTFTNNSQDVTTFWSAVSPAAYQDGVELKHGTPSESVAEDENASVDVPSGESIVATTTHEIRSGNPVEIEIADFWTGERIGVVFH